MKGQEKFLKILVIFTGLGLTFALYACGSGGGAKQPSVTQAQKSLFAMYVVGSDLESKNGSATEDFKEITAGLQGIDHQNLEIVVAFGGSQKQHWQGVKYIDKACLLQDAQDGVFGNDTCYSYIDPNANMGEPATLEAFLTFLKNNYSNYNKKILVFWDHGGAYEGFGWDPDTRSGDPLTLSELDQALSASGMNFDLIGFDACLMASLEVAKVMKPYASYMVASEESEPGHGWYYTPVITYIAQNPDASVKDIAKKVVDEFMNHPNADTGKTLSVVDLSKVDAVVQALNGLVAKLDDPVSGLDVTTFGEAAAKARDYGRSDKNNIAYSMDLKDFAIKVQAKNSAVRQEADTLRAAIEQAVIYSRQDGTRPNSYGLSVFNPVSVVYYTNNLYTQQIAASQEWFTFLGKFYTEVIGDLTPPTITFINQCSQNGSQGFCYQVTDNLVLKEVSTVYMVQDYTNPNLYYFLGTDAPDLYQNQPGVYFLEGWDGQWIQLCDSGTANCIIPSGYYYGETDSGNWIYVSDAILNNITGLFFMELDNNTYNVVDHVFVPYNYDNTTGELILSKLTYKLQQGDVIQFRYLTYDSSNNSTYYTDSASLIINNAPVFSWTFIAGQKFYWLYAEDFKGNWATGDLFQVQ